MRVVFGLLPSLALLPIVLLAGQAPGHWVRGLAPTGISLSGNTGPQIGVGLTYARGTDSLAPRLRDASYTIAGGYGLRGSWFASTAFRAPGLWPRWRVVFAALTQHETRFEFLGLGDRAVYAPDSANAVQPYYYKVQRSRSRAALEITRALGGGRLVAVAVGISRTRFDTLPGPSLFSQTFGSPIVNVDQTARVSAILDRRNSEYDVRRGFIAELDVTAGSGGAGYTRFTGLTRVYVPLGARTVVAIGLVASRTAGGPPLAARFELPVWEGFYDVLGGPTSHRGLRSQRFVGRDVEFGTVELRRGAFRRGDDLELVGAVFVDGGRVSEEETPIPTLRGLKIGSGLGLGARYKRNSLVFVYAAYGPDGIVVTSRAGWAF